MKLGLGVVLVGQLVHDVLLVRSILHSGLCGVIDVPMFKKFESA
jgi:hypothetical protein